MSKAKNNATTPAAAVAVSVAIAGFTAPKSVRDAGMMFERLNGDTDSLKAWAASGGIVGYPDKVPDEVRDDFKVGLLSGYIGRAPRQAEYVMTGNDAYAVHTPGSKVPDGASVYVPKLDWVASLKTNDMKSLKTHQPNLHAIVEPIHKRIKSAVDTAWHRFLKYTPDGATRAPSTPDLAAVWFGKQMESMLKRLKTAEKRGDTSVDYGKASKAIADFRSAFKGATLKV